MVSRLSVNVTLFACTFLIAPSSGRSHDGRVSARCRRDHEMDGDGLTRSNFESALPGSSEIGLCGPGPASATPAIKESRSERRRLSSEFLI